METRKAREEWKAVFEIIFSKTNDFLNWWVLFNGIYNMLPLPVLWSWGILVWPRKAVLKPERHFCTVVSHRPHPIRQEAVYRLLLVLLSLAPNWKALSMYFLTVTKLGLFRGRVFYFVSLQCKNNENKRSLPSALVCTLSTSLKKICLIASQKW